MDTTQLLPLPARHNSPTSIDAAKYIRRTGALRRHIQIVHALVQKRPGSTSNELSKLGGRNSDHLRHLIARRLPEAARLGLVVKGDTKKCDVTGRKAVTWYPSVNPLTGEMNVLEAQ